MVDLEPVPDCQLGKHRAHRGMADFGDLAHQLDYRIDDAVTMLEERRQRAHAQIAVLVDRHAEHRATMLADPVGVIGPAAEQRHAEGRPADDHFTPSPKVRILALGAYAARLRFPVAPPLLL